MRQTRMEKLKKQRIRLTRTEIEKAKQKLLEEESSKPKSISREQKYPRDFWRDGIYSDSYGWAWDGNNVCVGRTEEVLKRGISFPRDNENHSCHSKLKSDRPSISSGGAKFIVATFRNDPRFLRLLDASISKGFGIRAIRTELKANGYEIPLRTLARWIEKQKEVKHDKK